MSDLIFNPGRNKFENKNYNSEIKKPKSVKLLIKLSGGKLDDKNANYVLFAILGIIILAIIIIYFS